jgi:hypothetical protein
MDTQLIRREHNAHSSHAHYYLPTPPETGCSAGWHSHAATVSGVGSRPLAQAWTRLRAALVRHQSRGLRQPHARGCQKHHQMHWCFLPLGVHRHVLGMLPRTECPMSRVTAGRMSELGATKMSEVVTGMSEVPVQTAQVTAQVRDHRPDHDRLPRRPGYGPLGGPRTAARARPPAWTPFWTLLGPGRAGPGGGSPGWLSRLSDGLRGVVRLAVHHPSLCARWRWRSAHFRAVACKSALQVPCSRWWFSKYSSWSFSSRCRAA